jgi:hypothetical protein
MDSTVSTSEPPKRRRATSALAGFRSIPPIDRFPSIVSFVQAPLGKVVLLGLFGLELSFFHHDSFFVITWTLLLGLTTLMPEYRRFVLALAPIGMAILQNLQSPLLLAISLSVIALGVFLYWCAMLWPKSHFGRRPVLYLLSIFTLLIAVACWTHPKTTLYLVLWALVGVIANYIWFIAYALTDRTSKPAVDLTLELAAFRPFWGSTTTPFPKGAAYLRRIEARSPEELAITQLKGLKLLAWAIVLSLFSAIWNRFFHAYLHIPTSSQAIAQSAQGTPVAWHLRWESLILAFFESILDIAVMGHQIIGICRIAGFNALRNTYKPLASTTISEFFNRYYYYFKELLVDFFFYPTFLRYFKGRRNIRVVFATFAAAFFGNAFFHFTRDWEILRDKGFAGAFVSFEAYIFYCLILATGLSISELRKRRPRSTSFIRTRLAPAAGVGLFYCLLNVFQTDDRSYPLIDHLRYFANLFFVHF